VSMQNHQKKSGDRKSKKKHSKNKIEYYKCHEMGLVSARTKSAGKVNLKTKTLVRFLVNEKGSQRSPRRLNSRDCRVGRKERCRMLTRKIWLTDSRASAHMTFRREWLTEYREDLRGGTVLLGDNEECNVVGVGKVNIRKLMNGVWVKSSIENVLHVL